MKKVYAKQGEQVFQGDIGFIPLECFGLKTEDVSRNQRILSLPDGRQLVQDGEVTGHSHHFWPVATMLQADAPKGGTDIGTMLKNIGIDPDENNATVGFYRDDALVTKMVSEGLLQENSPVIGFLLIEKGNMTLRHGNKDGSWAQEHNDIVMREGGYIVVGKREMNAGEMSRVQD